MKKQDYAIEVHLGNFHFNARYDGEDPILIAERVINTGFTIVKERIIPIVKNFYKKPVRIPTVTIENGDFNVTGSMT